MSPRARTLLSLVALVAILASVALVALLWSASGPEDPAPAAEPPATAIDSRPAEEAPPVAALPKAPPGRLDPEPVVQTPAEEVVVAYGRVTGASIVQCDLPDAIDPSQLVQYRAAAVHGRRVTMLVDRPSGRMGLAHASKEEEVPPAPTGDDIMDWLDHLLDWTLHPPGVVTWSGASPDGVASCTITLPEDPVDVLVRVHLPDGSPLPKVRVWIDRVSRHTDAAGEAVVPALPGPTAARVDVIVGGSRFGEVGALKLARSTSIDVRDGLVVDVTLGKDDARPAEEAIQDTLDDLMDDKELLDRAAALPGLSEAARALLREDADSRQGRVEETEEIDQTLEEARALLEAHLPEEEAELEDDGE